MITIFMKEGCRRVAPCKNLDQYTGTETSSSTMCLSSIPYRDAPSVADRVYPIKNIPLKEYADSQP